MFKVLRITDAFPKQVKVDFLRGHFISLHITTSNSVIKYDTSSLQNMRLNIKNAVTNSRKVLELQMKVAVNSIYFIWCITVQKSRYPQVTTVLATSEMFYFQVITTY